MNYCGNKSILKHHKTAFLCSRKCPASVVLKCYDWAKEQRKRSNCIVCGNHSQIEKDVFEILLKGDQPLILVLARNMMKRWPDNIKQAIRHQRLLVISLFDNNVNRVTRQTALKRNKKMMEIADDIVVGHIQKDGQLDLILKDIEYIKMNEHGIEH